MRKLKIITSSVPLFYPKKGYPFNLVSPSGIRSVGEQELEDGDVARLGGDVDGRPAVLHGQVGVRARLEQHLGALLAADLLDPRSDVQRRLPDFASYN